MTPATRWLSLVVGVARAAVASSQAPDAAIPNLPSPAAVIPLYPDAAPGSEKWDWKERAVTTKSGMPMAQDVVRPVLLHYPAPKDKGVNTAMVIAPGGGFRTLMMSYEGVDVARRLNAIGVDAFVLKYRLLYSGPDAPKGRPPGSTMPAKKISAIGMFKAQSGQDVVDLAAADGRQSIKLVREQHSKLGVRRDRIGMIGYSAGGVVATEALFGPAESRPDFVAFIYGVGEIRDIPTPAPPLFLATADDDDRPAERSLELFTRYRKAKAPAELHIFQMGAHGFVNKGGGADHYLDRLEEWLRANKLLAK